MKVLYAEDTQDLNRAVTTVLKMEHYDVDSVFDGAEALKKIETTAYDCIILDVMMPYKDGMEVLQAIRAKRITTPVIMLTAKSEVDDRVAGLNAGADDYLPKPFAMKELVARIRSACRRSTDYAASVLAYGDVVLDPATFALTTRNSVRLSVKEFELMSALINSGDKGMTTDAIIARVWRNEEGADKDTVWLYVSYLKGKLFAVGSSVSVEGTYGGTFRLTTAKEDRK